MALSELSDRLDYLTSFSSQLVFVCTDKIKQQSQFVEDFISQQNEQTDLALLTANELTPLAIYREQLFHQLISHEQSANYSLPLNQVLADLNRHEGPVLISIFQAEKLPNKLVKEIWELVLQSRFANNKQHLNVLLMGHSDWAEQTKQAIAANSREKPILINDTNQPTNQEPEQHVNLTSRFYKQQASNQRKSTHTANNISAPIYKKWWFITLSCLIFLSTFSGMLYWLYPNDVKNMFATTNVEAIAVPEIRQAETELNIEKQAMTVAPTVPPSQKTPDKIKESSISKEPADTSNQITPQEPKNSLQIAAVKVGTESLVTDWQSASDKLNGTLEATVSVTQEAKETIVQEQKQDVTQQSEHSVSLPTDYPVADVPAATPNVIVDTVSQLKQPLSTRPKTASVSAYIKDSGLFLSSLANNRFVIQLAAMSNYSLLQEYAADNQLKDSVWLYTTQRYGGDWHVLLYAEHFTTIEQARVKIEQLSSTMQKNVPFAKSLRQVQQEIVDSKP